MKPGHILTAALSLTVLFILSGAGKYSSSASGNFDEGDTIRIGNQVWMKHNLSIPMPKSWFYENDSASNATNGRLYYYSNAIAACPVGWHLPSNAEWQQLIDFLGGDSVAGAKLKPGGGSGLDLPLPGYKSANSPNDLFGKKNELGFYWSSTIMGEQTAYARGLDAKKNSVEINYYRRANGFSVRLVKNVD